MKRRVVLIIMDGWGLRESADANAVKIAQTPNVDRLWERYPHTTLDPSGRNVGLPDGQMGNSEVGHLNLGAGRIVDQDVVRISKAIEDGEFFENEALLSALRAAGKGGRIHLAGLLSDGGVHSLQDHLNALLEMAKRHGAANVFVHALLDGRDTSPTGGARYLASLQKTLDGNGSGRIATVMGRYFCMDRDKRWDRVKKAYDALTAGRGVRTRDYAAALAESYAQGVTDEFVEPIVAVDDSGEPIGNIRDGDAVIFYNFRADRARQITSALTDEKFDGFERDVFPRVTFVCMTQYDSRFDLPVAFPPVTRKNILAEVAAREGCTSFRIAETEKYAHVTYFFNGGREEPYPGEERLLVPSPKVATYDMKPEMSAYEVTDALLDALTTKEHDYVVCNFANPDMVGHTGVVQAAVKAVETVDDCVGKVIDALDPKSDVAIVTADHGNAELMVDPRDGGPHTAHTTNPVPCILVDDLYHGSLITGGTLRDIAPTICHYLGITPPAEITGKDLRADL